VPVWTDASTCFGECRHAPVFMLVANSRILSGWLANGYAEGAMLADGTRHALLAPHTAVTILQRTGHSAEAWTSSLPVSAVFVGTL
jgi:hypothetical protein